MAIGTVWNETTPAGSDDPRDGDDRIREMKQALTERLRMGGHKWEDPSGTDAQAGRHVMGEEQAAHSSGGTGVWTIYESDETTAGWTVSDSTAASPDEINGQGKTAVNTINITSGNNPGHAHDLTLSLPLFYSGTGKVTSSMFLNIGNGDLTIIDVRPGCTGAPSGGAETFTLNISNSPIVNTDDPASVAVTAVTIPAITIASGEFFGNKVAATGANVIGDGDLLIPEVTVTNGAVDCFLFIKVRRS